MNKKTKLLLKNCFGHFLFFVFHINENIPFRTVNTEGIEGIGVIECSIKTCKWLCIGLYKPSSQNENSFLDNLSIVINRLICQCEIFTLIGNLNTTIQNKTLKFL